MPDLGRGDDEGFHFVSVAWRTHSCCRGHPRHACGVGTWKENVRLSPPGMEKINFSGGEPFLHERGEYVGQLVRFCKQELRLPSVSIVSNGSLIRERWFQNYGELPLGGGGSRALAVAWWPGSCLPATLGLGQARWGPGGGHHTRSR